MFLFFVYFFILLPNVSYAFFLKKKINPTSFLYIVAYFVYLYKIILVKRKQFYDFIILQDYYIFSIIFKAND